MPWTEADVDQHMKGLSPHQKKVWVAAANSALEECQHKGGTQCDAHAIRVANAAAGQVKALTADSALLRVAKRDDTSPAEGERKYGDVTFADEKNKKYPIDTEEHVRAALSYWGKPENRAKYSPEDQKTITARIHAAARRFGIDASDDARKKQAPTIPLWHRAFHPETVTDLAGDGVCGRVRGIALVYDVVDEHGTTFQRGCLEKTAERVRGGKVKLYWDHGDSARSGAYDTDLHIGIVRSLEDVQLPDGTWAAMIEADIFDTPMGREKHAYLKTVLQAGGETGLSIGMREHPRGYPVRGQDGQPVLRITEAHLREISITAEPSVPGTRVLHVRHREAAPSEAVAPSVPTPPADERDATPSVAVDRAAEAQGPRMATMEERVAAVRHSYALEAYHHATEA